MILAVEKKVCNSRNIIFWKWPGRLVKLALSVIITLKEIKSSGLLLRNNGKGNLTKHKNQIIKIGLLWQVNFKNPLMRIIYRMQSWNWLIQVILETNFRTLEPFLCILWWEKKLYLQNLGRKWQKGSFLWSFQTYLKSQFFAWPSGQIIGK